MHLIFHVQYNIPVSRKGKDVERRNFERYFDVRSIASSHEVFCTYFSLLYSPLITQPMIPCEWGNDKDITEGTRCSRTNQGMNRMWWTPCHLYSAVTSDNSRWNGMNSKDRYVYVRMKRQRMKKESVNSTRW